MPGKLHQPFSIPHHSASQRRAFNPQRSERTLPNARAVIDQRLVEGAQVISPFWGKPKGNEPDDNEPENHFAGSELLVSRDDDLQLDAFDLELLAKSDGRTRSLSTQMTTSNVDRDSLSYQSRPEGVPMQMSRFFHTDSHITPHRSWGSSSSDLDLISPSPLTRLQSGKPAVQRDLETKNALQQPPRNQSLRPEKLPPHGDCELSNLPQGSQSSPFQIIPMSVRGIVLVSVHELPDSYRSIFTFPVFNAIQSKCFQPVYRSDDNIVLASPTGSGKTVVMELAICRLLSSLKDERFKVVYQAPTKSLCSERFRDWNRKFLSLGLQCAELTGDTDHTQLRSVQNSQIIITTPEKWDSMTRKWKDHVRLMQLVKLFLIDEVHILKEARGATLEAVVSRMKTIGSNVRFVALSATVPNSEDIATWLGKDATNQHVPAHREHFGEEFRPVKLQKFVYGYQSHSNDFAFDKMCSSKLAKIIAEHSCKKPIMIFCCTRNSSVATAKELTRLWSIANPPARLWKGPGKPIDVHNMDLKTTIVAGVAFHHAGLDPGDRHAVETCFLQGQINIICCTSTLAVGVNLPCHLVIIKNTVGWQDGGCKEYSNLEMMQMLGRAGRPQFDNSATAVILTRRERVDHYEKLVSGSEILESCLHLNLIDHLNAEIGLGNVTNIDSAIRWLAGTFLFVRLRRNPKHYQLKEGANKDDEDEMLRQICEKDIKLLRECDLVSSEGLKSTEFGHTMARYYVRFETMKSLLTLKSHATISQILSVIAQAEEFRDIRLKAGEKSLYKEINRANGIRFPVKVDIALPAHKISLLIQSELGAVDFPDGEQFQKHKFPFQQDKSFVFSHINRLIRCVIDCQISLQDSISVRNALELARSFGAKVWDSSPFQMKQIDQIGVVAVRKLAAAGITSLDALEATEPHQIDMVLSKNPPFGVKLLGRLADFPKLRVSVKIIGKPGKPVNVRFKAEVAFMNEKVPDFFQRRPVHVCFLAENSDGHMIDFRRICANKLHKGHEIPLNAEMKGPDQCITCYAMCDDIAGTLRSAEIRPEIPNLLFPSPASRKSESEPSERPRMNISRPRSNDTSQSKPNSQQRIDIFDSDDLLLDDFLEAEQTTKWDIVEKKLPQSSQHTAQKNAAKEKKGIEKETNQEFEVEEEPTRLANGRWACNHRCKDKSTCKHFCCREGLEKPPKSSRKQFAGGEQSKNGLSQLTLSSSITKKDTPTVTASDISCGKEISSKTEMPSPTERQAKLFPDLDVEAADTLSYSKSSSSDYGDDSFDDLPSPSALLFGNPMESTSRNKVNIHQESTTNRNMFASNDNWIDVVKGCVTAQSPSADSPGHDKGDVSKVSGDDTIGLEAQTKGTKVLNSLDTNITTRNSEAPNVNDDLMLIEPSAYYGFHGQKRDLFWLDEDENDNRREEKRSKSNKFHSMTRNREQCVVGTDVVDQAITPTPPVVPNDWEDIDPSLLEEFKDIVNFF